MHASVMERLTPDRVCVMTQQRSGGRWQALDGGRGADNDGSVIPRQAPRHEAASSPADHEDTLVRMLYEEHAGPLLMFVLRLTGGDRQRAEDIVQETLLRAWRNAHRLGAQGQSSLRPWLVTVARRIAIDDHRSENARPPETYGRDLENFSEPDETDRVLRLMTVTDALRTLSQPHREIILETYFRGKTVPQESEQFEEHLAGCWACAGELESMLPVVNLLSEVDGQSLITAEQSRSDGRLLDRMIVEVGAHRRKVRSRQWLAAAAAGRLLGTTPRGSPLGGRRPFCGTRPPA